MPLFINFISEFMSSLSEFSYRSLSFFIIAILDYLSFKSLFSMTLNLLFGDFSFSLCAPRLAWLFMGLNNQTVPDGLFLCSTLRYKLFSRLDAVLLLTIQQVGR